MTAKEKLTALFVLLILCLFITVVLPSPKIMDWLGWGSNSTVASLCGFFGFCGSAITFGALLVVIFGEDKETAEEIPDAHTD